MLFAGILILLFYVVSLIYARQNSQLQIFYPYWIFVFKCWTWSVQFVNNLWIKLLNNSIQLTQYQLHPTKFYYKYICFLFPNSTPKNPTLYLYCYLLFLGLFDFFFFCFTKTQYIPYFFYRFVLLAMFPAFITYVLCVFCYRISYNLDLKAPLIKPFPSWKRFVLLVMDKLSNFFYKYVILRQNKTYLCNITLESLTDNFYFLKKYYRLNDLIWQDGFLIDFLQKKVADRWVRTFIIYSGYLFSERFLFDIVVRFYIDFVIWPTYSNSIYEFSSVSATLTFTLLILMKLFLIISLYNIILII